MVDWKEQSLRLWQSIDKRQRYILGGIALLLFLFILGGSYWWGGRPEYVPLFTNMEAKDAGEVAAKLKELKVPYEIGNNGTAITVHSKDVYRVRLELASIGLPRGNKGFEIFDQNKFGVTEFQNKVYLLQALQGELSRTIEQLAEVEKARVHIVMPEDSLYKKNEKPATASIMLKLRANSQLSREQVRGVVNLVAHSIQGLKVENITVVDNFARVLNEDESDSLQQFGAKANVTFIELTKKVQDGLQKSAQSMLEQVLGPGKAAVRVNVELNFDQRIVDKQTFQPVVDDKGIVRSMQETTEAYKGNAGSPGGTPGVAANIPGYVTGGNTTQSNYDKKEITRNYEINETKEKVVAAPGSIKRLTVSVLVDANVGGAQQESITKVVSSAVGLNPARGDAIAVEVIPFSTEATDRMKQEELSSEQQGKQDLYFKIGIVAIILILGYFIARLFIRRKHEDEVQIVTSLEETEPIEEVKKPVSKPISPEEKERIQQRETIERLAKAKPDEIAQLVRAWLGDE
jgi:flagellar M-ring protein FliF